MIELEVQALSLSREGLLIDVGRSAAACGFALVRQRLADDANGVLLTMVVRGPERKQRALETALDAHERIISFEVFPHVEGEAKPHFAASRKVPSGYVPPPPPAPPAPEPVAETPSPKPVPTAYPPKTVDDFPLGSVPPIRLAPAVAEVAPPEAKPQPVPASEPEPEFVFVRTQAPAPAAAPIEPFVEVIQLDADQAAVEKLLPKLISDYPQILPLIKKLEQSVQEGARESTLVLAGQRIGAWWFERQHALKTKLSLEEAMQGLGMPSLSAWLDVEYQGQQLHIRNSPLCTEEGHSSCKFVSGFLEGLLGPVVGSQSVSIFAVCCRSCGADECVLAVME